MSLAGVVERGGVELHKLHVLYGTLGAVDHSLAVAGGNHGVGGGLVDGSAATGTHHGDLAQIGVYLLGVGVEHVGSIAVDIGSASGDARTEVVLGNNLYGKMVFLDIDVGVAAHGFHQSALYLGAGVVGMVQDAELGVASLAVQVELTVVLAVEVDTPVDELLDLLWRHRHYLFYGLGVADVVTGYHGVFDMLLEIVFQQIGYRRYSALGEVSVSFVERCLAYHADLTFMCSRYLKRITHSGYA